MREKLIELLEALHLPSECDEDLGWMADKLIANGVTLDNQVSSSKWISVKDRLPENRDDVLVCRTWWNETRNPQIGWYNDVAQEWQILDSDGYYPCGKVTYWMPLPQPPKGE